MSKSTTKASAAELIRVTLLKPHTHADQELQPGSTIEVTAPERDFLRSAGVIDDQSSAAADAAAAQ